MPKLVQKLSRIKPIEVGSSQLTGDIISDFQEETGLETGLMMKALGMKKSYFYAIRQGGSLKDREKDALIAISQILEKGKGVFDGSEEDLQSFLHTPNENLGNIRPVELLETEIGRKELNKALDRIDYGIYG